jgi:raffinose/stachyose/melibiose transport system substrate-binding protein
MKRSPLIAIAALAIGAISLTGCSASGSTAAPASAAASASIAAPASAAPSANPATPTSAAPKPTLTMWVNAADTQAVKDFYKKFETESGYKVEVTSFPSDGYETAVLQRWATGDRPDIFEWSSALNWLAAVNPSKNLFDLSKEAFVSKTVGGLLNYAGSMNGVSYGALINTPTSFGLYYNKKIIAAAGIDTPPTTSAELLDACAKIKKYDPNIAPFQENGGSQWTPLVFHGAFMADSLQDGFLAKVNNRTAKLNDADSPWLASLVFYKKMQAAGCFNKDIMTAKFETTAKVLLDGKAAFASMHTGFIQQAIDASDQATVDAQLGWTEWADKRPVVTSEGGAAYYVPKTGKADHEAGAMAFIRFITGPAYADYVVASNQLPILSGVDVPAKLPAMWKTIQAAVVKYGQVPPIWGALPGISDLVPYNQRLIMGELTPQAAVDLLQKEAAQGSKSAGLPTWNS